MALPLPPGLVPSEVSFLCEMEQVTVVPRQRLDPINLLSGKTPPLRPPHRSNLPLWLALLLKKQRRANILPPPWLHPSSLTSILAHETHTDPAAFSPPPPTPSRANTLIPGTTISRDLDDRGIILSPPFVSSNTSNAPSGHLPYHWFELAEILLAHAADDIPQSGEVRRLLRDLQEARAAKMRGGMASLGRGDGIASLRGVGAMELAESRGFILGVVDGVRKIGASAEATRRDEERGAGDGEDESDEDMGL